MKHDCPVCKSTIIKDVYRQEDIPFTAELLYNTSEEAISAGCGTLDICLCKNCGFVFNREFEGENVKYDTGYNIIRTNSGYFKEYLNGVVKYIDSVFPIKEKRVLEVGCHNGDFLEALLPYGPSVCVGVDPNAIEPTTPPKNSKLIIRRALFDEEYLHNHSEPIDILACSHVIEHIENPLEILKLFASALNTGGVLYLETPRLDWILENRVFYDFNYEHCSYFTDVFMINMLSAAGFSIIDSKAVFGEQYFSIIAEKTGNESEIAHADETRLKFLEREFEELRKARDEATKNIANKEDLYLWGASAKGVMSANIFKNSKIAGLIDINPLKQGKYIPNSRHIVLSPAQISYPKVKNIAVLNDVYLDEIQREVTAIDPRIKVGSFNKIIGLKENKSKN